MYVIGIGFRPLEKKASYVVLSSDVVLANNRLLDVFKDYEEYEKVRDKILVHGSVYETIDYISDNYQKRKLSLLAAGDPMFFGIGRLIIEKLGQDAVEVFPDISSIQVAFSRAGETSNNAMLISLHGGPDLKKRRKMEHEITDLPELLDKHEKIAVLTDKVNNPQKIAEVFLQTSLNVIARSPENIGMTKQSPAYEIASPSVRNDKIKMFVCEKLGYPNEKIIKGTPQEISKLSFEYPNVVIIINRNALSVMGDEMKEKTDHASRFTHHDFRFGLKEDEIEHSKGLITKDEIRAVTIHKLRLSGRGVLWDIGAGSGSVSIEAARLCPEMEIIAIEKNEEQIGNINNNIMTFKTGNLRVVKSEAPHALNELPLPDRVFIGGSGKKLDEIVSLISKRMDKGIVVINATTIETLNNALQSLEKNGFQVDVTEVSVSRSKMINQKRHMSALNPIFIIKGEK